MAKEGSLRWNLRGYKRGNWGTHAHVAFEVLRKAPTAVDGVADVTVFKVCVGSLLWDGGCSRFWASEGSHMMICTEEASIIYHFEASFSF